MKFKKLCFMLMLLALTVGLLANTVYAGGNFTLSLKANSTTCKKGETISVKIDLSDVSDSSGLCGYQGKLVYDSNVLTLNNVTSTDWEVMENEGRNGC